MQSFLPQSEGGVEVIRGQVVTWLGKCTVSCGRPDASDLDARLLTCCCGTQDDEEWLVRVLINLVFFDEVTEGRHVVHTRMIAVLNQVGGLYGDFWNSKMGDSVRVLVAAMIRMIVCCLRRDESQVLIAASIVASAAGAAREVPENTAVGNAITWAVDTEPTWQDC